MASSVGILIETFVAVLKESVLVCFPAGAVHSKLNSLGVCVGAIYKGSGSVLFQNEAMSVHRAQELLWPPSQEAQLSG